MAKSSTKHVPLRLYGIRNCDTVKRAQAWLGVAGIAYDFHDFKIEGIDQASLERWCAALGWEGLINRAGATFRRLPQPDKVDLDQCRALALMRVQPMLIRRPVIEGSEILLAGFKPATYRQFFFV
ncbi:MAG: arsenate reductase [Betaproteobacteria bacterium]|nr:arsenate reductase [Betaproteobacteria bacterium]